jgi:hypothetical protein
VFSVRVSRPDEGVAPLRFPLPVHEAFHQGPLASCAAPRQGVSAPCNDANFIVPSAARTVGRGRSMLAAVWFRNQPNMVGVGIPDIGQVGVLIKGREDVVFRAHASGKASAGPMAPMSVRRVARYAADANVTISATVGLMRLSHRSTTLTARRHASRIFSRSSACGPSPTRCSRRMRSTTPASGLAKDRSRQATARPEARRSA